MKRSDEPKMVKLTATAPFVLSPVGPARVDTFASSAAARVTSSCSDTFVFKAKNSQRRNNTGKQKWANEPEQYQIRSLRRKMLR